MSVQSPPLPPETRAISCEIIDDDKPVAKAEVRLLLGGVLSVRADDSGKARIPIQRSTRKMTVLVYASTSSKAGLQLVNVPPGETSVDGVVVRLLSLTKGALLGWVLILSLHSFHILWRWKLPIGAVIAALAFAAVEWEIALPDHVSKLWRSRSMHIVNKHLNDQYRTNRLPNVVRSKQVVTLDVGDGICVVEKIVQVEAGGMLVISPGTILRFQETAGIMSSGSIRAQGTKEKPIQFTAVDSTKGWAHVAIMGAKREQNTFEHCSFFFGRGGRYYTPVLQNARNEADLQRIESEFRPHDSQDRIGGAMLVYDSAGVIFEHCEFSNNQASAGGALYIRKDSTVTIKDCRFTANQVFNEQKNDPPGGAIYLHSSHLIMLPGTEFYHNTAVGKWSCGGAVYVGFLASATFEGVRFRRNAASHAGGAVYCFNMKPSFREPVRKIVGIESCKFLGNQAGSGSTLYVDQGVSANLVESEFYGNRSGIGQGPVEAKVLSNSAKGSTIIVNSDQAVNEALISVDGPSFRHQSNAVVLASKGDLTAAPPDIQEIGRVSANLDDRRRADSVPPPLTITSSLLPPKVNGVDLLTPSTSRRKIDTIVIHHISGVNWFHAEFQNKHRGLVQEVETQVGLTKETLPSHRFDERLCIALMKAYGVSAHYLINRAGKVIQLVRDQDIAFHAGVSAMPQPDGRGEVNEFSLGIEMISAHPDDDAEIKDKRAPAYTEDQYSALERLIFVLCHLYDIESLVGHDEIATGRKTDPGPLFDWNRVRKKDLSPLDKFRLPPSTD